MFAGSIDRSSLLPPLLLGIRMLVGVLSSQIRQGLPHAFLQILRRVNHEFGEGNRLKPSFNVQVQRKITIAGRMISNHGVLFQPLPYDRFWTDTFQDPARLVESIAKSQNVFDLIST